MTASAARPSRPEPAGESPAEPVAGAGTDPAPSTAGEPDVPQPAVPEPLVPPEPAVPEPAVPEAAVAEPAVPEPAHPQSAEDGGDGVQQVEGDGEPAVGGAVARAAQAVAGEPGTGDVAGATTPAQPGAGSGPPRMRLSRAVTLVLLAALGFGGVVAARSADPSFSLATARPDELAASLGAIGAENRALASQEGRLRREAAGTAGAGSPGASPAPGGASGPAGGRGAESGGGADAERARADELAILAGTVPVDGPGLELTIRDPHRAVDASVLVDALQELRDAGAEAIEIAGVRAVVSTYVADEPGHGLIVDGRSVAAPYVLRVVGDAHTLDQALRIPGGVLDTVAARDGAQASVRTLGHLEIRALRPAPSPRYARPAG
ncbi:protein of unknown function (DUF881) [Frankia torreyi]|uniref:DUF881 domain-containing protein n=1 Tax=Frankia torreyi TaxID=1856 RepID=A0A0D8BLK6_9ACTN|nr:MULTISPECIES: DUF881 domain-containing protein [Frankia]KJE24894.1 protein of unknown function (DUF881) [Frankia torreyi]KQM06936.1 protein of unknown function (DUF881) [Frankia sp. CpI1-P]